MLRKMVDTARIIHECDKDVGLVNFYNYTLFEQTFKLFFFFKKLQLSLEIVFSKGPLFANVKCILISRQEDIGIETDEEYGAVIPNI